MTKRKSTITCMLAASLVLSASAEAAAAGTAPQVQAGTDSRIAIELDGQPLVPEISPVLANGTVLVPIRDVFEPLGAKAAWNGENKTVTAAKDGMTLVYRIGEREAQLNGQTMNLTVPGLIADGHTLVPLRFVSEASDALAEKQADKLIAYGKTFEGTPYEFGASPDQTKTFDCSSFVKHVFASVLSIELPRVSYDQAKEGKEVSVNELRKGDLLFFSSRGLDIGHVGIYAGNNKILHTYSNEWGVHIGEFDGQWKKRFVTARRVF
ncbi:stalk domain-containing protein [Paenibacillus macerans]|uniref:C40 family peptidase n=1 Tax=Paenibacillus macerans TaxID=44252 RepID=UPI00203A7682|nr:NlpC/P60 family protein [Paenibacillus macerans]MCM3703765.1 NlpC/P60 family protein [Paenibacillus macerans]